MTINRTAILAAAALALLTPAAASAQATGNAADPMMTTPMPEDDRDEFPWGLLGLLGLAGLLGMKRRDDDVHVHRTGTETRRP